MAGISARELSKMRDAQDLFFPDTCTVRRPTKTKNAAGSHTVTWTNVYTALPCEATPKVLRQLIEHVVAGGVVSAVRWNITMPYGTVIELDDQIVVHATGGDEVYEVNGVQGVESYETAVTAQCLKVG